jgi:hypothetical protein
MATLKGITLRTIKSDLCDSRAYNAICDAAGIARAARLGRLIANVIILPKPFPEARGRGAGAARGARKGRRTSRKRSR